MPLIVLYMVNFNSRPSARGDPAVSRVVFLPFVFQFTPLREGRRVRLFDSLPAPVFQFTPLREGRRWLRVFCASGTRISIHAPPRGATAADGTIATASEISIHAPPRGATDQALQNQITAHTFQFTPLREGRLYFSDSTDIEQLFQFTPLREGRRMPGTGEPTARKISIHAPPRGATDALAAWLGG